MFQEIYIRIGFNLMKQRRLKGWTQEQLAEKSGVSRSRISKMENGKENFNIESLFLIAQSLEIDFIELLKWGEKSQLNKICTEHLFRVTFRYV